MNPLSQLDFETILRKGALRKLGPLTLRFLQHTASPTRFGFVISKKVSKKAVDRNKIRRRLKAILQKRYDSLIPGFDVVIIVGSDALKFSFQDLTDIVEELLQQAKILHHD
jgi:ribonuclease P protein component